MPCHVLWSQDTLPEPVLSFHPVGSELPTQVIGLADKYPLGHLALLSSTAGSRPVISARGVEQEGLQESQAEEQGLGQTPKSKGLAGRCAGFGGDSHGTGVETAVVLPPFFLVR